MLDCLIVCEEPIGFSQNRDIFLCAADSQYSTGRSSLENLRMSILTSKRNLSKSNGIIRYQMKNFCFSTQRRKLIPLRDWRRRPHFWLWKYVQSCFLLPLINNFEIENFLCDMTKTKFIRILHVLSCFTYWSTVQNRTHCQPHVTIKT